MTTTSSQKSKRGLEGAAIRNKKTNETTYKCTPSPRIEARCLTRGTNKRTIREENVTIYANGNRATKRGAKMPKEELPKRSKRGK